MQTLEMRMASFARSSAGGAKLRSEASSRSMLHSLCSFCVGGRLPGVRRRLPAANPTHEDIGVPDHA